MSGWRKQFDKGEQFILKGHLFVIVNVGKRNLALRRMKTSTKEIPAALRLPK
jgi:hypothetical protein